MSIEAYSRAWTTRVGDPYRKLVLLAYADHAHRNGRNSFPSKKTVAEYAECDLKTVKRHTTALLEAGFMRRGDQSMTEQIRADRRPVVYDIAMDDETRIRWQADAARGVTESPRPDEDLEDPETERGVTKSPRPDSALSPRDEVHGGADTKPRGGATESPEPSTNPSPPTPNTSAGLDGLGGCAAHRGQPHATCRACGTAPRAEQAAADRDARRRRRELQDAQVQADRRQRATAPSSTSPSVQQLVTETRTRIHSAKGSR